jgi:purine-binding chemotaxis protein CheW
MTTAPSTMGDARGRFKAGRSAADKYLTFALGNESFGVPILKVQEIIGLMEVTPVPRMPDWVRGVINLRGKVIPVVELRRTFNMESVPDTRRTCIVVVQVTVSDGSVVIGCVVDQVSEVQNIPASAIEPPPSFGTAVDTAFIVGMGMTGKKVVILLDIDKVLTRQDLATVTARI